TVPFSDFSLCAQEKYEDTKRALRDPILADCPLLERGRHHLRAVYHLPYPRPSSSARNLASRPSRNSSAPRTHSPSPPRSPTNSPHSRAHCCRTPDNTVIFQIQIRTRTAQNRALAQIQVRTETAQRGPQADSGPDRIVGRRVTPHMLTRQPHYAAVV
ncbi:uncharacterized protein SCHCODRAFT_02088889, partial [Schizophyllum commune H4-8]|uniref:uncharacterized protein n=1 Tax=Schizophyllum commune (strain H4-8 / FGSC 9210) TaxID=578458 RepID=UPI00215E0115